MLSSVGNAAQREILAMLRADMVERIAKGEYPRNTRFDSMYDNPVVVFEIVSDDSYQSGEISSDGIVSWN